MLVVLVMLVVNNRCWLSNLIRLLELVKLLVLSCMERNVVLFIVLFFVVVGLCCVLLSIGCD